MADGSQSKTRNTPKQLSTEDEAVNEIAKQADARLAIKRAARAEVKYQEEMNGQKHAESLPDDVETLQAELLSLREKYQQAMLVNVQHDNIKQTLRYQIDSLKEELDDLHTAQKNTQNEYQRIAKDADKERRLLKDLESEAVHLRQGLAIRTKLIDEYGLKIEESGEKAVISVPGISMETAQILVQMSTDGGGEKYVLLAEENEKLELEVRRLQRQVMDEKDQVEFAERLRDDRTSRTAASTELADKEVTMLITETRLKLKKAEQDLMSLEGNAARLDSQAKRFQASAETAEKNEQELTAERDRLKGELSAVVKELSELKAHNDDMQKTLDNWKMAKQNSISKPS